MLGVACFLSICITTVGVVRSTTNSNVLSSSIPTLVFEQGQIEITKYEFAGYANWTEFTSNCCCEQKDIYTNGTLNSEITEIWKWYLKYNLFIVFQIHSLIIMVDMDHLSIKEKNESLDQTMDYLFVITVPLHFIPNPD